MAGIMEETGYPVKLAAGRKTPGRRLPGFGLEFGVTVSMLSMLVLVPLASVLAKGISLTPSEFASVIAAKDVRGAFFTSVICAFSAACADSVFGLLLA